jgi:DNA-binding NarL/FixJ family response regulator
VRRVRVALVEDNRLFRETLALVLGLIDEVEVVGSFEGGAEAIEACEELKPDVVVLDYRMPGLDGAEVTRALLRVSPETRVVCLTASVSQRERDLVLAAGAVTCLTKDESLDRIAGSILEVARKETLP